MYSFSVIEFKSKIAEDYAVLDARSLTRFPQAFLPGSIFIGPGEYSVLLPPLLNNFKKPFLLIAEPGKQEEIHERLKGIGLGNVEGYLQGGFNSWKEAGERVDMIIEVEADELALDIPHDEYLVVLDVRSEIEFAKEQVKNAMNIPLEEMTDIALIAAIEETQNIYILSNSGYRSMVAASLLKRQGYHNLRNIIGGWQSIMVQEGIPIKKEPGLLN